LADIYGARNENDIIFVTTGPLLGSGFFVDADKIQRLGADLSVKARWRKFEFRAGYGVVLPTFEFTAARGSISSGTRRWRGRIAGLRESPRERAIGRAAVPGGEDFIDQGAVVEHIGEDVAGRRPIARPCRS
jgi:hypothetical protein